MAALTEHSGPAPTIYLMAPANNTQNTTERRPYFTFNASAESAFACTLYLNGTGYGYNSSVENNTETAIRANATLANGDYDW